MVSAQKIIDNIVYHCPYCAGGLEFDIAPLLVEGPVHEILCPHCSGVFTLDITDPTLQHRYVNILDNF